MSLVIASRYNDGIILASDSFVMSEREDGRILTSQRFDRPLIIQSKRLGIVYVGSVWVYNNFIEWFKNTKYSLNNVKKISDKWAELNNYWLSNRKLELSEISSIPLSKSILILANVISTPKIQVIDYKGEIQQIDSFIIAGSGSDLIKPQLTSNCLFDSTLSLGYNIEKLLLCYKIASADIAVSGIPSIGIIEKKKTISLNSEYEILWKRTLNEFYKEVKRTFFHNFG